MKWILGTAAVLLMGLTAWGVLTRDPTEVRCELAGRVMGAKPVVVHLPRAGDGGSREGPQSAELTLYRREMTPAVIVLQRGDTLSFYNRDTAAHRIHARSFSDEFQLPSAAQGPLGERVIDELGHVRIGCDEHPWERADVLVLDNRQFSFAAADGTWTLPRVLAGQKILAGWSPDGATGSRVIHACGPGAIDLVLAPGRAPEL